MSKRRNRRVTSDNANRRLPFSFTPSSSVHPVNLSLSHTEDRREWHPEGDFRPARSFSVPRHRLSIQMPSGKLPLPGKRFSLPHAIGFANPRKVLICVRRKARREVLHAFRKAGRVGQRRPVRNAYSSVRC